MRAAIEGPDEIALAQIGSSRFGHENIVVCEGTLSEAICPDDLTASVDERVRVGVRCAKGIGRPKGDAALGNPGRPAMKFDRIAGPFRRRRGAGRRKKRHQDDQNAHCPLG